MVSLLLVSFLGSKSSPEEGICGSLTFQKFLLFISQHQCWREELRFVRWCKEKLAALFIFSFELARAFKLRGRLASQKVCEHKEWPQGLPALAVSTAWWPQHQQSCLREKISFSHALPEVCGVCKNPQKQGNQNSSIRTDKLKTSHVL